MSLPAALLRLWVVFHGAADTACTESGINEQDGACVLQVVRNRAGSGWARYSGTLGDALFKRAQHAHNCPMRLRPAHLRLAAEFLGNRLRVPEFCRKAQWYCGKYDKPGTCENRGGAVEVGQIAHRFFAPSVKVRRHK